ncbi:MAG: hypothetical protein AB8E15_07420 [Bdellovibrionales bacterium]
MKNYVALILITGLVSISSQAQMGFVNDIFRAPLPDKIASKVAVSEIAKWELFSALRNGKKLMPLSQYKTTVTPDGCYGEMRNSQLIATSKAELAYGADLTNSNACKKAVLNINDNKNCRAKMEEISEPTVGQLSLSDPEGNQGPENKLTISYHRQIDETCSCYFVKKIDSKNLIGYQSSLMKDSFCK